MKKVSFITNVGMFAVVSLALPLVSMSSLTPTNLEVKKQVMSNEEKVYYDSLTSSEKQTFEELASDLNMGSEQSLNTLRYKFGDVIFSDESSVFSWLNSIADFLVSTMKTVVKDEMINRAMNWLEENVFNKAFCVIGELTLTAMDIASWVANVPVTATAKLIEFSYTGDYSVFLHLPDLEKCRKIG